MDPLGHYLRTHLAGSAAGRDLFARSAQGQKNGETRTMLRRIHDEIVGEQDDLRSMAEAVGVHESAVMTTAARVGERLGLLKPNGALVRRTHLADLVELETLIVAVNGKIAGWESLMALQDERLPQDRLEQLHQQGLRQEEDLRVAHREAAARALSRR